MSEQKDVIAALLERFAKRSTVEGQPCLVTDGDPVVAAAFETLGWDDPHPVPEPQEIKPKTGGATHEPEEHAHHERTKKGGGH